MHAVRTCSTRDLVVGQFALKKFGKGRLRVRRENVGEGFVHGRGLSLTVLMHTSHVHRSCRHHLPRNDVGAFCFLLLFVALSEGEWRVRLYVLRNLWPLSPLKFYDSA